MKTKKLMKTLKLRPAYTVEVDDATRLDMMRAAIEGAKSSGAECEIGYVVSGDSLALAIKEGESWALYLTRIDMEGGT